MAAVLAENYQLKWHSHSSHLHGSIATLYRSDNFADVTLVTSDGRYLTAHRFVLSACSSYLNRVLQIASGGGHMSPLVVVLPPEVSYRTLAILLQYMYSGEATVSNEQLNGVLRAGELLRIKGLCHNPKEKRYPQEGRSSSNSGLSLNFQPQLNHKNPQQNPSETCNPSSSTSKSQVKSSTPKPKIETKDKPKVRPKDRDIEVSSSGEGSEIVVEDNMKIELLVKEEPLDWDDDDGGGSQDDAEHDIDVKTERFSPGDCEQNMYAPLTCDLCHETFTTPSLWVRHIETHPVSDVPHKRRKKNPDEDEPDDEEEFPLLRCELCQKVFTSPGDWVRHIQSSHTEEQLALNNSNRNIRKNARISCPSCNKTFPSLASMLIHSRTHTGEKPYICCVCEKGFNVKSNLLRHLRTLHDHLMNPGNQYSLLKDT